MNDLARLAQDLRAHVHEVRADISKVMREAAAALDEQSRWISVECSVQPPPFPPPAISSGKHQRPRPGAPVGVDGRATKMAADGGGDMPARVGAGGVPHRDTSPC